MAQEFIINSSDIESKINQLLPSQGGFGAGVDFSASTMVIPIVDLTETAEGSNVRVDLQTALSFRSCTEFAFQNTTSVLINTTGYYKVVGQFVSTSGSGDGNIFLTDGATNKRVFSAVTSSQVLITPFEFVVFINAGDELKGTSSSTAITFYGVTRQIADINGNLVNPL